MVDDDFVAVVDTLDRADPDLDDEVDDLVGDLPLAAVDFDVRDFELADLVAVGFLAVDFVEVDLEVEDFLVVGILIPPSKFECI